MKESWIISFIMFIVCLVLGVMFGMEGRPLLGFLLVVFGFVIIFSFYPVANFIKKIFKK